MNTEISISYDKAVHTITWKLGEQSKGAEGEVALTVHVLNSAIRVDKVTNTASVQVGNDPQVDTNTVENPVSWFDLPETGGIGASLFWLLGSMLLLSAAAMVFFRKKDRFFHA